MRAKRPLKSRSKLQRDPLPSPIDHFQRRSSPLPSPSLPSLQFSQVFPSQSERAQMGQTMVPLSFSLPSIPSHLCLIDSFAKALMKELFALLESSSSSNPLPLSLHFVAFLVARSNLYFDHSSLFQSHSKLIGAIKSKSLIGELASQMVPPPPLLFLSSFLYLSL